MRKTPKRTPTRNRRSNTRTADALAILDRVTGSNPRLRAMIAEAAVNAKVSEMLFAAREKAGLTQAQLARRIGTKQPVIARLENADYQGHSLKVLQKIAAALGQRLEVRFAPA